MKLSSFLLFLYLIFESFFYLVIGQKIKNEKSDCTKLYNFLNGDTKDYGNDCCTSSDGFFECDSEGYITLIFE